MVKIDPSTLSDEQRKALKVLKEDRDKRFQKEQKRNRIVVIILLVVVILLSVRDGSYGKSAVLPPEYDSVGSEPNAYPGESGGSQNDGALALNYADEVSFNPNRNKVSLHFGNGSASVHESVVQIIMYDSDGREVLLTQSGILKPGYSVDSLEGMLDSNFDPGSYDGVMRVLFYTENGNGDIAATTDISVTITVK